MGSPVHFCRIDQLVSHGLVELHQEKDRCNVEPAGQDERPVVVVQSDVVEPRTADDHHLTRDRDGCQKTGVKTSCLPVK